MSPHNESKKDIKHLAQYTLHEYEKAIDELEDGDVVRPGYCPKCGVQICDLHKVTKNPHGKSENYRDYWVILDNESKMMVGYCADCVEKITDDDITEQMRRERNSWAYQTRQLKISDQDKLRILAHNAMYDHCSHQKDEPSDEIVEEKVRGQKSRDI